MDFVFELPWTCSDRKRMKRKREEFRSETYTKWRRKSKVFDIRPSNAETFTFPCDELLFPHSLFSFSFFTPLLICRNSPTFPCSVHKIAGSIIQTHNNLLTFSFPFRSSLNSDFIFPFPSSREQRSVVHLQMTSSRHPRLILTCFIIFG